jgi:hypothetical protein
MDKSKPLSKEIHSLTSIPEDRYLRLTGTASQVGYQLGESLQNTLGHDIDHYLTEGPLKFHNTTEEQLISDAMDWFSSLPQRFRTEMEGMADGSGVRLSRIAEWAYADSGGGPACSAFLLKTSRGMWIGRNNDLWVPDLWGYAIRRQVTGRLGTLIFGMRGEIFAATGLNQAGLWLHYNWLPARNPTSAENAWTPYVLLTEILETCKNVDEVQSRLESTNRTGGMLVFAADDNGIGAILECSCTEVHRQDLNGKVLAGTNHYQFLPEFAQSMDESSESITRLSILKERIDDLPDRPTPQDLIQVLSDPGVEQYQPDYGTVYANLYTPMTKQLWFTFGGFPAASRGNWQSVPWPF